MLRNVLMALAISGLSSYAMATENEADFEETESTITNRMRSLGYPIDEMSLPFYGLAVMGSQAVLREEGLAYKNRMENILAGRNLIDKADIWAEQAFFDGVVIYSAAKPSSFKMPIAKNAEDSTEFLKGDSDAKEYVLPHLAGNFLSSFDKSSITELLESIKSENHSTPFSLLMTTEKRDVQVGFDGTAWLSVNHGKTTYGVSITEAIDNIFQGQTVYDDRLIASVAVFSSNKNIKFNTLDSIKHNEVLRLSPENKQQNLASINLALRGGHLSNVDDFSRQILNSDLDSSDMVELLVAKDAKDRPGFFYTLVISHIDVITNFTQQVLSSDLDWSDIVEVLSAKEPDGFTGFDMARYLKSTDGVEAFEKVVENTSMQQSQKDTLFAVAKGEKTVIARMLELNYQPDEGGMCYGLAAMAAQATIRNEGQNYYDRIQQIKSDEDPQNELDELAFFDGVSMYANMFSSEQEGFEISDTQNIASPAKLFSENTGDLGFAVPKVGDKFLSVLTKETLIAFLEATRDENKEKPFALFIVYTDHAVQIGFDGQAWLAVNHDVTRYSNNLEEFAQVVLPKDYLIDDKWVVAIEVLSSDGKIKTSELNSIKHNGVFDLSAKHKKLNRVIIKIAMQAGFIDTVINFTQQVLDSSEIESSDKVKMLSAMPSGGSISQVVFTDGSSDIVTKFTKQILDSNLDTSDKVELIAAKTSYGTQGINSLAYSGDADKVANFTKQILESNLDATDKVELLAANSSGSSWLSSSYSNGDVEMITKFTNEVIKSNLDSSDKAELIAAKTSYGTQGINSLAYSGDADKVANVAKQILESNLDATDKVELLAAKSSGSSWLSSSYYNGDVEMITRFTKQVLESNLDQSDKVELLAAKSSTGSTGLSTAKLFGKTEVVQAFEQAVNASTLEQSYKDELLKP